MVYVGRRAGDQVKGFQQKSLAVMCPFAGNSCLNNQLAWVSVDALHTTHQCIPFFNVTEGMNTNLKLSQMAEGLNPK